MTQLIVKLNRAFVSNSSYYTIKLCSQPDWATVTKICGTFRVYDDMVDSWQKLHDVLKHFGDDGSQYVNHSGPGHWLDPGQVITLPHQC